MTMFLPLALASMLGAQPGQPPPGLDQLLARVGEYVVRFSTDFVNVVSEERYVQRAAGESMVSRGARSAIVTTTAPDQRELLSDFLLVRLAGAEGWVPFRDTFEVDGKPVRERQDRLSKLLLHPTDDLMEQAARILAESTRYNIGNVTRTINTPLLALTFLDPAYQPRFRYSLGKEDTSVGAGVWVVKYEERSRPTFVRNTQTGHDIAASGRYWIEGATGTVLKTEMLLQDSGLRASVIVSFRFDDRFQLSIPFEMAEEYTAGGRTKVSGRASYSRFRRFDATATETIASGPSRWITEPTTGMVLVELTPGQFPMGSLGSETGRNLDETMHDVKIAAPFYLGLFEVTQQEWKTIMGTAPSRAAACGPRCPVESVSFEDARRFLAKLNARSAPDIRFRLPTEAEWEYACRAGTASSPGAVPRRPADNGGEQPRTGGSFDPNAWGLYDLTGNVSEWTADWYGPYPEDVVVDPPGPRSGDARVVRGGSWESGPGAARCAARNRQPPQARRPGTGFRVAADFVRRP